MITINRHCECGEMIRLRDERGQTIGIVRRPVASNISGPGAATVYAMPAVRPPVSSLLRQARTGGVGSA